MEETHGDAVLVGGSLHARHAEAGYFHNRNFSSLDLVIDALCQGLNALANDPERLRSLTGFPHLKVTL